MIMILVLVGLGLLFRDTGATATEGRTAPEETL
jgi:hypothetical protein